MWKFGGIFDRGLHASILIIFDNPDLKLFRSLERMVIKAKPNYMFLLDNVA